MFKSLRQKMKIAGAINSLDKASKAQIGLPVTNFSPAYLDAMIWLCLGSDGDKAINLFLKMSTQNLKGNEEEKDAGFLILEKDIEYIRSHGLGEFAVSGNCKKIYQNFYNKYNK